METNRIIWIDNGHGSDTAGKRSPDGCLREGVWAREVARMVVNGLRREGVDARLLTPERGDVPLRERVRRVNARAGSALVVSVHVNAAGDGSSWHGARGFGAYVDPAAGRQARAFAALIGKEAAATLPSGNRYTPECGYHEQGLYLCRYTRCAAVLTENLFMDNREDCAYLLSAAGKGAVAQVHVRAILKFLGL